MSNETKKTHPKNSPIANKSDKQIEKWKDNISEGMTKDRESQVNKLCEAFRIDANISEACAYAEISRQTYYNWIKENPELIDKFNRAKNDLSIRAKMNIARSIAGNKEEKPDLETSKWYLMKRRGNEFGDTLDIDPGEDNKEEELTRELSREDRMRLNEVYEKELHKITTKKVEEEAKKDGTFIYPKK